MGCRMFHEMYKKALLSSLSRRANISSIQQSQQRLYASSTRTCLGQQFVDKTTVPPPKASTPKPLKEEPIIMSPDHNKTQVQQPPPSKTRTITKKQTNLSHPLPTTGWVLIRNIPPLSTLEDILQSVNEVMDTHLEDCIVDLDAVWKGNGQVTLFQRREPDAPWVKSAHVVLSSHGRPSAWRIEFCNRSVAHAFCEYARQHDFSCAWKIAHVERFQPRTDGSVPVALDIDDTVVRVENAGEDATVDTLRHLFRRYDMTRTGPSVQLFNQESQHRLFLVHFADASWARAAIRELQGTRLKNNFIRLAQYPRQLISSDE